MSFDKKKYDEEYQRTHRDKVNAAVKKWRKVHPEEWKRKNAERARKYREENREKYNAYHRAYQAKRKAKTELLATVEEYRKGDKEKRLSIRELVEKTSLSDEKIVQMWMNNQPTPYIFDLFDGILKDRIKTFEVYARMVKSNCQFNMGMFDGDEKHLKLVEIRNKLLAGENIDGDWGNIYPEGYDPEELARRHIDGADYIKKVNNILKKLMI